MGFAATVHIGPLRPQVCRQGGGFAHNMGVNLTVPLLQSLNDARVHGDAVLGGFVMAVVAVGFELPVWIGPFQGIDSVLLVKGFTLNEAVGVPIFGSDPHIPKLHARAGGRPGSEPAVTQIKIAILRLDDGVVRENQTGKRVGTVTHIVCALE